MLSSCCCEGSEAIEGWRAMRIGLQLSGSRINFNRRDASRTYNVVSRDRIVPVSFSPSFSSVDESIHSSPVDEETARFMGSGVPAVLPRIKITAREGPSQCSAQITVQWQQEKVVLREAFCVDLHGGDTFTVLGVAHALPSRTLFYFEPSRPSQFANFQPSSPYRSTCGVNISTAWHCL